MYSKKCNIHTQSMKLRTWSSLMTLSHLNPSRQLDMHCSSMSDWTCTVHCSILLEAISQKELQWFQTPVDRAGRGRTGQRSLCRTGLIWLMVVMRAAHCYSSVVASWLLHARATTSVIVLEIVASPFVHVREVAPTMIHDNFLLFSLSVPW